MPMTDLLSRCDRCGAITPHDKLIHVFDSKTDTTNYYCSWECVEEAAETETEAVATDAPAIQSRTTEGPPDTGAQGGE